MKIEARNNKDRILLEKAKVITGTVTYSNAVRCCIKLAEDVDRLKMEIERLKYITKKKGVST